MRSVLKSKIVILIYLTYLFEVQCSEFEKREVSNLKKNSNQDALKRINRSADWSKRISPLSFSEVHRYVAAESENVEVTTKPPRIIRRLKIQHNGKQSVETFKEINPKNRPNGRLNKIVRIKKIRRKTTLEPLITTPEVTTRKQIISTSTFFPKITFSSPYAHITVINKETKNPKINKKNKKKHKYHMISTPPYDNEAHKNFLMDVSEKSDHRHNTQAGMYAFNMPHFHSDYRGFNDMHDKAPRIKHQNVNKEAAETDYFNIPRANDNFKNLNTMMSRSSYPLFTNENVPQEPFHQTMDKMNYKVISPKFMFIPHENFKDSQTDSNSSNKENLKESSSQLKEIVSNSESNSTQPIPKFGDKVKKTIKPKIKESSSKKLMGIEETTVASSTDEISNKTELLDTKHETSTTTTPAMSYVRSTTSQPDKFPLRFPSLLFGEQNAFSDPFFDTPGIPSPRQANVLSWNSPPSPFYGSASSQNDGYFSGREMQPYHSDDVVPGFQHSPQLEFLRRSIQDGYVEESTTLEPVTAFSLPKFEIPSIDFNDKGCQTVYKEVKTVPGDDSRSAVKNEKSFIMTRECYFPNGVPTTERAEEVVSTEASVTAKTSPIDSKT